MKASTYEELVVIFNRVTSNTYSRATVDDYFKFDNEATDKFCGWAITNSGGITRYGQKYDPVTSIKGLFGFVRRSEVKRSLKL